MTVAQSICKWLKTNDSVEIKKIETEFLPAREDSYAIYNMPTRTVKDYLAEMYEITEYYTLLIRQSGKDNNQRQDNAEWLENLVYWVDDCNYNNELPKLDNDRLVSKIELSTKPYPSEQDGDTIVYQVSVGITYTRTHKTNKEVYPW